jgi:DNA-directed RNA polymerase specialized sigma24 family protein
MTKEGASSTRTTLLGRVRNWEDDEGWGTFFQIYRPLIHNISVKSGLNADEAEEVAQDTLIEVARRLKNREYDPEQGSFRGWLFRLTRWRITNQFNKRQQGFVSMEQAEMSNGLGPAPWEILFGMNCAGRWGIVTTRTMQW